MRRCFAWLVGPLMLATFAVAAVPASAATASPSVSAGAIAGQYTAYAQYGNGKWVTFSLTLYRDHTGTDHFNDTIVWSTSYRNITMTFDDGLWTYLGRKTRAGFNNARKPGTLSNVNGGSGTWYAVKLS